MVFTSTQQNRIYYWKSYCWEGSRLERPKKVRLCSVEATISVIGGKWKPLILHQLLAATYRFGELHRAIPCATQQMLTQQLRELEADGIVHRKVYAEVPPKVEYSLTEYGRTLEPVLLAMHAWGQLFLRRGPSEPGA
ncbi:MAG: helix-turn-helix transcriptional regulator [Akkermansiaceae bacterium]|nr:helix-turn-helix transcriptional regulator [Armatimonadota bacterium]